jgi:hypothetical protein
LKWIKFVYYGEQIKPHGTLIIAVDSSIFPKFPYGNHLDFTFEQGVKTMKDTLNASANAGFGWAIQTDQNTLDSVAAFVQLGKYAHEKYKRANAFDAGYGVIDSKGVKYYLPECSFSLFFKAISEHLKDEKLDTSVAISFKYYYSFWRKHYNGNAPVSDSVPPPLGIPITKSGFDSLVQHVLLQFHSPNITKTAEDCIMFVRVNDTYAFYSLWVDQNDTTTALSQLFRDNAAQIFKILGAHGGGSTLFAKNGMMIGGWAMADNFYRIQSACELSPRNLP